MKQTHNPSLRVASLIDDQFITRVVSIALIVLIVLSGVGPFVALSPDRAEAAETYPATLVDGFEDGNAVSGTPGENWGDWAGDTSVFSATTNSIKGTYSGALHSDGGTNRNVHINHSSGFKPSQARLYYKVTKQNGNSNNVATFKLNDGGSPGPIVAFSPDGNITTYDGASNVNTGMTWSSDVTYNITFTDIDYQNDTFRLHVNGNNLGVYDFDKDISQVTRYTITNEYNTTEGRESIIDDLEFGRITDKLSGQVVNQYGEPVPNATVAIHGVAYDHLDAADKAAAARDKIQEYTSPIPDSWNPNLDLKNDQFSSADTHYVAITRGSVSGDAWFDSADLSNPQLSVPANEEIILTAWDPDGGGLTSNFDEYDSQLPGVIEDDAQIVIERIDPSGGVINATTIDTDHSAGGGWLDPSKMEYAKTSLSDGFYYVYVEGAREAGYPIKAGTPIKGFDPNIPSINGSVTDYSKELRSKIGSNDLFIRKIIKTNETGHFSTTLPGQVKTVAIQSYKAGGELPTNATIGDLRSALQTYNGSYVITPTPTVTDVPASGVTVATHEFHIAPYQDFASMEDRLEWLRNYLTNQTFDELSSVIQQQLGDLTHSRLVSLYHDLLGLAQPNDDAMEMARDRLEEQTGSRDLLLDDASSASTSELETRISVLDYALSNVHNSIPSEPPESEIGSQTVDLTFPFGVDLDPEAVAVFVHYSNGTTRVLNSTSEYVVIDKRVGGDAVLIQDYPIGNSSAAIADFEVKVSTSESIGSSHKRVQNPTFTGIIPGLESVSFSTLHPGPNESVTLDINPADSAGYGSIEKITVYGPDGSPVTSSIVDGEKARFETAGPGVYKIRATYTNANGDEFVIVPRVEAGDIGVDGKPTVIAHSSPMGVYALTGDGLDGGDITLRKGGTEATFTAQIGKQDEVPSEAHYYTSEAEIQPDAKLTFRVARGENLQSLSTPTRIYVHTQTLPDGTLIRRNGGPLPFDTKVPYGKATQVENGTLIKTVSDSTGAVTVRTNANPGILERMWFQVELLIPDFDLPGSSLDLSIIWVPPEAAASGFGLALPLIILPFGRRHPKLLAITLTCLIVFSAVGPGIAAAAESDSPSLPVVSYGADGHPSYIIEYEEGGLASLQDWAESSERRQLIAYHNQSGTATIAAPAWEIEGGIRARLAAADFSSLDLGPLFASNPLKSMSYIKEIHPNYQMDHPDPVSLSNSSAFETPRIGRFRWNDPVFSTSGLAYMEDANESTLEGARQVIGADNITETGTGVTVAVIDTGVNVDSQPGRIYGNGSAGSTVRIANASKNFVTNEMVEAGGYDAVADGNGHGSWTASAIAANYTGTKYDGVAPDANLLVLKALDDEGSGSTAQIANAIRYAADNDADVISASLGSPIYSKPLDDAIQYAFENGVSAVVVAVGNSRQTFRWVASPADVEGTISVAATNASSSAAAGSAYFSQIGPDPGTTDASGGATQDAAVDVAAPGMRITAKVGTTDGFTRNSTLSGTSMATPLVAGGIATALEANPGWKGDPATVRKWVRDGARPMPNAAVAEVGHGMFAADNTITKTAPEQSQEDAMTDAASSRDTFYRRMSDASGGLLPLAAAPIKEAA